MDVYKQSFDAWEKATAELMEVWLRSPLVLQPAGYMLTAAMKMKSAGDRAAAMAWGRMGLATKRDQERTLHLLNELESRLMDLEEKIEDLAER